MREGRSYPRADAAATEARVFRALAHPVRRAILDRLQQRQGLTLKEIASGFEMTRQGCAKHLALLEEAHLVLSRSVGKERHHYLNAAPVQAIYDRWVSRYAGPWARGVADLKARLEAAEEESMHHPDLIIETYVETTPERLWRALTSGDDTERYYFGTRFEGAIEPGAPYVYRAADGTPMITGTVVSADAPRELVMTFLPTWAPAEETRPSRATFTIEPRGGVCKLTLRHDRIALDDAQAPSYRDGWSRVLSGLKTLLESGRPMGPVELAEAATV